MNPIGSTVVAGKQAALSGGISGGMLTSIAVTTGGGALYRAIDSSYTYDSSGWYENIPVTGGGLTGATVNIKFGIVTEVIKPIPNVYQVDTTHQMPCDGSDGAAIAGGTTDHGVGLTVTCSSHQPLVSFGKDNLQAVKNVNDYETAQIAAHAPACVKFSGRFLSSAIDLNDRPAHLITGGPCLLGDAQILSGIFIFPAATKTGDLVVFPIVDASGAGSFGRVQQMVTDPDNGVKAGTFIDNLTFWGDSTSPVVQNAIKFYGFTQWATMTNLSSWNLTGCLICVGVDNPGGDKTPSGQIAESTFFNIRTEHTGDVFSATPAFGLDGVGVDSNNPNNDLIIRYRTYDDNGVPLTIRPCVKNTKAKVGTEAHELTVAELKVEESNMEYQPTATDGVQVGETAAGCNAVVWGKSDGGTYSTSGTDSETGVHGLTFIAPNIVNPSVGTAAFHFKGCASKDLMNMRILGGAVSSTPDQHGIGVEFDVGQSGNVVDLVKNDSIDYNLIYSGTFNNAACGNAANVVSGGLEYDGHDSVPTTYIDSGISVMAVLRCALGQVLTGCDGANGQLVDANSTQVIANKTVSASVVAASTIKMANLLMSPTAPIIAPGSFGAGPSIIANGSAAFQITVGASPVSSTGTIRLATAANGWVCSAANLMRNVLIRQTSLTTISATFTNYDVSGTATNWTAGDKIAVSCQAF